MKWAFVIFGCIALLIAWLSEYLKHEYYQALYAMNFKLNDEEAVKRFDQLQRYDFIHSYKKTRALFDVQVESLRKHPEMVLQILEREDRYFRSSPELLLIRMYYSMRSYLQLNNHSRVKKIYKEMDMIRSMKKPPKLFSFDEIDGMYYLACNDHKNARRSLKNVNMKYMNPKERIYVLEHLVEASEGEERAKAKAKIDALKEMIHSKA